MRAKQGSWWKDYLLLQSNILRYRPEFLFFYKETKEDNLFVLISTMYHFILLMYHLHFSSTEAEMGSFI